jgi:tight adherence protein B
MLIALTTFAIVLGIMLGAYWMFVLRDEDSSQRQVRKRLKTGAGRSHATPELLRPDQPLSKVAVLDRMLKRSDRIVAPLRRQVQYAGMSTTIGTIILSAVFLGLVTAAAIELLLHLSAVAVIFGILATAVPFVYVRFRAHRRQRKFEEQFPEALDLISRALRAGHAFATGLGMVADELPEPVGAEFRLIHDQQNYGRPLADALRDFGARVPLLDARFFVTAVLTQRESGGNLAEVLDNLAGLIRERFKVKRHVRAVSAHGRITGWVLAFLAPTLAVILFLIAPEHMKLLIEDPLGVYMITGAMALQTIGVIAIRRIINIEV